MLDFLFGSVCHNPFLEDWHRFHCTVVGKTIVLGIELEHNLLYSLVQHDSMIKTNLQTFGLTRAMPLSAGRRIGIFKRLSFKSETMNVSTRINAVVGSPSLSWEMILEMRPACGL
jgi:hypothetical protein